MDGWKKERAGDGRYMVYADGRRIGFVCGGRDRWCAERGPHTVGYFPTVKAACAAIHAAHVAGASGGREFVVWGIPPGETAETILYSKAGSMEQARRAADALAYRHGCAAVRVQVVDMGQPGESVAGMFRAAVDA